MKRWTREINGTTVTTEGYEVRPGVYEISEELLLALMSDAGWTEEVQRTEDDALRKLVSDWQANGNSRPLGDPTAKTWHEAARQLLDLIEHATSTLHDHTPEHATSTLHEPDDTACG